MTWLFESPATIAVWSVILGIAAGVAWSFTGKKIFIVAIGLVIAGAAGLLIAEKMIITDREAIELKLREIADDLAHNRHARIIGHIATSNLAIQATATQELPNYTFTEVRITKIHSIEVDTAPKNRTAKVDFNIVATGTFRQGADSISDTSVPRMIKLDMIKEDDGEWRVDNYSHAPPQEFLFKVPGMDDAAP